MILFSLIFNINCECASDKSGLTNTKHDLVSLFSTIYSINNDLLNTFYNFFSVFSIFYVSYYDIVIVFVLSFSLWGLFQTSTIRKKLSYYISLLFGLSLWGFYFSFDGFVMLLLTTEFLIVSLFLFIILTNDQKKISNPTSFISFKFYFFIFLSMLLFSCLYSYSSFSYLYKFMYVGIWDVFPSDLFIFFYTFFMAFPSFIFFFTLILSLFTIFFILFYFSLRKVSHNTDDYFKGFYFLRKQARVRQETFQSTLRGFSLNKPKNFKPDYSSSKSIESDDYSKPERFIKLIVPKRKFFNTQRF